MVGGEAAFLASMSRCRKWDSRGGKSNAYFAKSRDDRRVTLCQFPAQRIPPLRLLVNQC